MKSKKSILSIIDESIQNKLLELDSLKEDILNDIVEIEFKEEILQKLNEFRKNSGPLFVAIEALEEIKEKIK